MKISCFTSPEPATVKMTRDLHDLGSQRPTDDGRIHSGMEWEDT